MTIDERLEALTMNLELTARDVADLQKAVAEMQKTTADMQKTTADMQRSNEDFRRATVERFDQWQREKQHLDEKVDSLADSTRMLLVAVQAQQVRIERLERRNV